MSEKIKVNIVAKNKIPKKKITPKTRVTNINLTELREKFTSDSYYRTTHSIVNKINNHFGWEESILPILKYEDHFDEIMRYLVDTYVIHRKETLTAKLSAITHPLKIIGYTGHLLNMRSHLKKINIPDNSNTYIEWDEIVKILETNIYNCRHPGGKIIALTYKYGYLLSISEITKTKIDNREKTLNYLDLDDKIWYIVGDINKNKPERQFNVNVEFIDLVRKLIRVGSSWLISKKAGNPYTSPVAMKHLNLSGFTINQVKRALEKQI